MRLLGWFVRRTSLTASPCSSPGKRPNIAVSVGPGLKVFTRIPRSMSSALRIRARWTTAALQVETVDVVGQPFTRANRRISDDRRASPEQRQGLLDREVSSFEIDGNHLVEALLRHVFEQQELAVTCIYENAFQVPELPPDRREHRVEIRELADVRAKGETSGTERHLRRLKRPLIQAANGDAPSRSNSCAVASPMPLLPPVIRIFLSASLPIVVTP